MTALLPGFLTSSPGTEGGGGGLLYVESGRGDLVDPLPTTGMCLSPDGSKLARLVWTPHDNAGSALYISDHTGLLLYRRLDEVSEPHSLLWVDDQIIVVSTHTNSVLWLDDSGRERRRWTAPGTKPTGDYWHLNSLTHDGDRLLVSAFGVFDRHRGWAEPGARDGAGIVFDLCAERIALTGLSGPHDPIWLGDSWLVCNSMTQEVRRLKPDGETTARVRLGGWTRGLLVENGRAYVGVGVHRDADPAARARIAVLELETLTEVDAMPLPGREVFALSRISQGILDGLRVGARTGALQEAGSAEIRMETPLAPADCVVRTEVVGGYRPGETWTTGPRTITVRVTNLSAVRLSGLGPYPVRVGARWRQAGGDSFIDGERGMLSHPLDPGRSADIVLEMRPPLSGESVLRVGAVQEFVRWFDEVSPQASQDLAVRVDAAGGVSSVDR